MDSLPKRYLRRDILRYGLAGLSVLLPPFACSPAFPQTTEAYDPLVGVEKVIREFHSPANPHDLVGQKAPALFQYNINSHSPRQGQLLGPQDYAGKIVFLNLWASWCGPCRSEFSTFADFQKAYPDDLAFLALEADENSDWKSLDLSRYNFPILEKKGKAPFGFTVCTAESCRLYRKDVEYADLGVVLAEYLYGRQAYPTTFVIDRKQIVREVFVGELWERDIEKMLGKYR
ncbi:TlpA family protein disulfide reductase [Candidatus Woesearchaeota archaeon]|nr:TlpA family protein disulfide reductase [Candidatus Woesearchaeota archaeon]